MPPNIIPDNTPQGKSNQSTTGENAGEFNEDGSPKEKIYKSDYKSTNLFANEIHRGIGKEMTDLGNQNNANQWKKEGDLKNKESSIVLNQGKVEDVASNKIEQGAGTHMVTSLVSNTADTGKNVITSILNTYNKAAGKTENIKPLIKSDKHLVNMEDKDLKLDKNKKDNENETEAKSSNASVSENQNNKSKSGD
jgi:hypothetical protein